MITSLTPSQLDETRHQFNDYESSVRGFITHILQTHILQNTIYKHGQLSTIYFALGLDGAEPYAAPFPNTFYAMLREETGGEKGEVSDA